MSRAWQGRLAAWSLAGMLLSMALLTVWRLGQGAGPAQALASKAARVDLVGQLQLALASAAEAEKSAVLAVTDDESRAFAERSRAATASAELARLELARRLEQGGTDGERALLAQFTRGFELLRAVDDQILGLAVRNTNLKARALAFGPAAAALEELDGALAALAVRLDRTSRGAEVQRLADRVRLGGLRIQALLAPHVEEERDAEMSRLEATMSREAGKARAALRALAALVGPREVAPAAAAFDRYLALQAKVVTLSRENTNVHSLALSLGQKRAALGVCQDALGALQQAILEEPVPGVAYGRASPTR